MSLFSILRATLIGLFFCFSTLTNFSLAADSKLILASTTSTQNSGLFDHILPLFHKETGITVHVVAVGTGAALKLARNGDADVLMVHHKASEEKFVSEGFGVERFDLMFNDFVLIGPKSDPAGIKNETSISTALKLIANSSSTFLSRGDDSGTHKRELELWNKASVNPKSFSGDWYREAGAGMGATLNVAAAMEGYVLADRATWISFKNKQSLEIRLEGDTGLFNQYGVILVNPKKHSHVNESQGKILINWLLSSAGQNAIASYKLLDQQLFTPNAKQ